MTKAYTLADAAADFDAIVEALDGLGDRTTGDFVTEASDRAHIARDTIQTLLARGAQRFIVTPHAFPLAYSRPQRSLVIEAASEADAVRVAAHHIGDLSDEVRPPSHSAYWSGTTHAYYVRAYVAPPAGSILGEAAS